MEKIGLFGGSFNPVHHGHLIVARSLAERVGLSRVIFLPCGQPPHKDEAELIDGHHRGEMVKAAIAGERLFSYSDFDLTRPGPTYTTETVRHFHEQLGSDADLHWIIGADTLGELPMWHQVTELVDECRVVTAVRPGWTSDVWNELSKVFREDQLTRLRAGVYETPMIDISATDIRRRIAEDRSVSYLMPDATINYIRANDLYLK